MDDPREAAIAFFNLCKGELHMQLMMNIRPEALAETISRQVRSARRSFLRLYGTKGASADG